MYFPHSYCMYEAVLENPVAGALGGERAVWPGGRYEKRK